MINRDFCVKVHTCNNFKILLLLEVVIREKKFSWDDNCRLANVTITPVATLSVKTINEAGHLIQFSEGGFLQSELKDLFEEKVHQLVND